MILFALVVSQTAKVSYEIHAGLNIYGLHVVSANGINIPYSDKAGFNGGVDFELPISSKLTIQPELSYSEMGASLKMGESPRLTYNEKYLILPIFLKYHLKGTGFSGYIGTQYDYLLHSSSDYKEGTSLTVAK